MQAYGSDQLDAALLLMPLVGFLPGSDPRVKGTVEAIERELMPRRLRAALRHRESRGRPAAGRRRLPGLQLLDGFSSLKAIGRKRDAQALFEKLLALRNDVGLLCEEYDPEHKRMVGNFPQAFSHIALVNAAFDLEADGAKMRERQHRNFDRKPTKGSKSRAARSSN